MAKRVKRYPRICAECGRRFKAARPEARYHNVRCRWKAWDKAHPRVRVMRAP